MFNYIPEFFKARPPTTKQEADGWYEDKKNNRRTPDLLPRDEVARAINSEVKAGRGSPHGGVFLDIASRRPADYIRKRLPSMYHQFKELAGVDITKEAMEVGPTCHYLNGGLRVEADSAATRVARALRRRVRVAGGLHGANRLGGNSLSDLVVFGRRAGTLRGGVRQVAPERRSAGRRLGSRRPSAPCSRPSTATGRREPVRDPRRPAGNACRPSSGSSGREGELRKALEEIAVLRQRARKVRQRWARVQPRLAPRPRPSPACSRCPRRRRWRRSSARRAAGGHTRDDYPFADDRYGTVEHGDQRQATACSRSAQEPIPPLREDLKALLQEKK